MIIKPFLANKQKYKSVNTEAELKKLYNLLCIVNNIFQTIENILNKKEQELNNYLNNKLHNFNSIASQSLNSLLKSVESGKLLSEYDNSILESTLKFLYMIDNEIKRCYDNGQKVESIFTDSEIIQFGNLVNLISTIYEINYKILQNQELKRKVFLKNLAEESNIITTNNNFNIDESHSKSIFIQPTTTKKIVQKPLKTCTQSINDKIVETLDSQNTNFKKVDSNDINHSNSNFIQPITSEKILEKPLKARKQSSNDKIVKIIDSPDITFQKVKSTDTNQSNKLQMTTKFSSSIFIKTNQIINYKTNVTIKKLYKSEIKSVTNFLLPKTKNNVKNSFGLAHEYKKHFPKPNKTTTPLYEILKPNKGNIKSTYHTNQKKRSYQQTLSVSANRVTRYYIHHNDTFTFCSYTSATYIEEVQKGVNKVNRFLKFSYKIKCKFKEKIKALYLNLKQCRNKFVKRSKHIVKTNNQSLNIAINISFDSQQQLHRSNS